MKQRKLTKEQYVELFCQEKRIRSRRVVYISEEVHKELKDIVSLFHFNYYTTRSSLVDAILKYHIKSHRILLNELRKEAIVNFRESFNRLLGDKPEEDNEPE